MTRAIYDKSFFDQMTEGSVSSARVVLPLLFRYFQPKSVIDVGCGRGAWLRAAAESGIEVLHGIDGDYVDRELLLIDEEKFHPCDLTQRIELNRRFDLAISVEVAEHLPFARSDTFVADLVKLSDVVLFSAALPYQGGTDHINEQWLEFWAILFRSHGYVPCDLFRQRIWGDKRVEYWYSQNLIVFCKEDVARRLFPPDSIASGRPLSSPHPLTFLYNMTRFRPLFGQVFDYEFDDYRAILAAYLAGETALPLLKMASVTGEAAGGQAALFPAVRTRALSFPDELAMRDRLIEAQEAELQQFRTSKVQRLKNTIVHERLSPRKCAKIIYLLCAMATPERVRRPLRPFLHRLRRTARSAARWRFGVERPEQDAWPSDRPLISVVIPCFNYGRYVEGAVDSVLSQTFQDIEIILVDGGSTDDTRLFLKSFQRPKTSIHLRDGYHLLGDNRNFGISQAKGKYICCLDADDRLKPTYLEKALFLLENYHYDIVSTSVQCFGSSDAVWQVAPQPSLEQITQGNQFSVVAVFARKMWETAGGYHDAGEGKDLVAEDWNLWVRMMALGARAANIAEPLMLYRVHAASMSKQPQVRSWAEQAESIRGFNRQHLGRENYQLSKKRNAAIVQMRNPSRNLAASYRKEPRKPAILLALPYMITGGADTVFLGMARHITAEGVDLSVVTTVPAEASYGDNTARYEAITRQVYHLHRFLDEEEKWRDFLFHLIETRRMDILLLSGCTYIYRLLPSIKRKFPRLKVIDHLYNEQGHLENNRKYAAFIDAHIVVNDVLKAMLMDRFHEEETKIRVIKPGIDLESFHPESAGGDEAPRQLIPRDKFVVAFIGRFSEEKAPGRFVEIADLLRSDSRLHFVMLGDGVEYFRTRQRIVAMGLERRFHAPGNVSDVRAYLKMAGALVISSNVEGLPVTLMEAMALGVPVVASAVGGIPSVVRDGFNGFVCQPSDVQGFADKIKKIANDPELHAAMRVNARHYALEHFSADRTNREYLDLFRQMLPQSPA